MSLAAGIVPSGEVHREDGPATCAAAHAQQRAGSRESARLPQRTFTWKPAGFSPRRFLEVLAVLRRAQTGSCEHRRVRNHPRTEFSSVLENARVGQGRSQWGGALGVAVRAQRVTHLHRPPVTRPQRPWRHTVGVGHLDCGRWRRCFSSAVAGRNGVVAVCKHANKLNSLAVRSGAVLAPCRVTTLPSGVGVNSAHPGGAPERKWPAFARLDEIS